MVQYNHRLGEFILVGMEPRKSSDECNAQVTFNLDHNGILNVRARDTRDVSVCNQISIDNKTFRLSEEQILMMIKAAENFNRIQWKEELN